jgi:hypothetical protein
MSVYGVSGSGTYAVTLSGLDELMSALPNNTVNQIRAQDARNVVYTLWESLGGGGGGSFSYTQTAPFSQASVDKVGGIPSGTTFSNVSLQDLLDRMFFPPVGTVFSISTSITALEYNNPSNTTTVTVSITKKNPTINTISVLGPGGSLGTPPTIPTTFNETSSKSFTGVTVTQNTNTTYTLNLNDGTPRSAPATVTWFFPRWYGSIDLNQLIDPNLDTKNLTPAQKTTIINRLRNHPVTGDQDWSPVWNSSNLVTLTSFQAGSGQLSSVTITPKNNSAHFVLIWPSTDYGDGDPTDYTFGVVSGRPFVDLGFWPVENQYGYILSCRIWIRTFKSPGTESFTINN